MADWKKGDRFQVEPLNCGIDGAERLVFVLTSRAKKNGRRGYGWYFYAPSFDTVRSGRWYALADLDRDLATGKIRRLPASVDQPRTDAAVGRSSHHTDGPRA